MAETLVRNWRVPVRFALGNGTIDTAKTLWIGANGLTQTAPVLQQDATTQVVSGVVSADTEGRWTLILRDSASRFLRQVDFDTTRTPANYARLGLSREWTGQSELWPAYCLSGAASTALTTGIATARCFINARKFLLPYRGYVTGVKMYTTAQTAGVSSIRFFTISANGNNVAARAVTENVIGRGDISWQTNALTTIHFVYPLWAEPGDALGIEIVDSTGTRQVTHYDPASSDSDNFAEILTYSGTISTSSAQTFAQWGGSPVTSFLRIRPLMNPPAIGIAGLSHWAGSPDSTPVYADRIGQFVVADDPASMLSEFLGVPCVNMAWGGTDIRNWVGTLADASTVNGEPVGLFEKTVVNTNGFYPAAMLFDTVYNDAADGFGQATAGFTERDYLVYWDRLLEHCDRAGIELMVMEAFGSEYATANNTPTGGADWSAQIEKLNRLVRRWCEQNGVFYIPMNWRLGQYDGTRGEAYSSKYAQKRYTTDNPAWGLENYMASDTIHLTRVGRYAAMRNVAAQIANRRYDSRQAMAWQNDTDIYQPASEVDYLTP